MITSLKAHLLLASRFLILVLCLLSFGALNAQDNASPQFRRLDVETYRQKMKAGWLGQMMGVAFGGPTEFRYVRGIIPEADMPKLRPGMINDAFPEDESADTEAEVVAEVSGEAEVSEETPLSEP